MSQHNPPPSHTQHESTMCAHHSSQVEDPDTTAFALEALAYFETQQRQQKTRRDLAEEHCPAFNSKIIGSASAKLSEGVKDFEDRTKHHRPLDPLALTPEAARLYYEAFYEDIAKTFCSNPEHSKALKSEIVRRKELQTVKWREFSASDDFCSGKLLRLEKEHFVGWYDANTYVQVCVRRLHTYAYVWLPKEREKRLALSKASAPSRATCALDELPDCTCSLMRPTGWSFDQVERLRRWVTRCIAIDYGLNDLIPKVLQLSTSDYDFLVQLSSKLNHYPFCYYLPNYEIDPAKASAPKLNSLLICNILLPADALGIPRGT